MVTAALMWGSIWKEEEEGEEREEEGGSPASLHTP